MGNTKNSAGKRVFDDAYSFPQDSQDLADDIFEFANVRVGPSSDRQSLPGAKRRVGMLWAETDTGEVFLDTGDWKLWSKGWTNYSPAISGFTLAGGKFVTAKYKVDRGLVTVKLRAAVAAMAANPTVALPVSAADALVEHLPGTTALIPGAGSEVVGAARKMNANQVTFFHHLISGTTVYINNISASVPFAWGAAGTIAATFSYESV